MKLLGIVAISLAAIVGVEFATHSAHDFITTVLVGLIVVAYGALLLLIENRL